MTEPVPRLLVVDNTGLVRDVLWEILEHAGFALDTAQTASEAVERLTTRRYAAIVADCLLPDLLPLDWLAAARGTAPGTPPVLCSGIIVLPDLQVLARDWRAAAVLEKPFEPAELVAAVRGAVARPPD